MSKTKTKRARREAKRDHAKKASKAARASKPAAPAQTQAARSTTNPKPNATPTPSSATSAQPTKPTKPALQASQKRPPPFGPYDRILLVGEGDFNFTHSLCIHHGCANVVATSYDSLSTVQEKYPSFASIAKDLEDLSPPVPLHFDVDAKSISLNKTLRSSSIPETMGIGEDGEEDEGKEEGIYDTICFQFPHTGGLSTDVNRQVRANQALLVGFFESCLEVGDARQRAGTMRAQRDREWEANTKKGKGKGKKGGEEIKGRKEGEKPRKKPQPLPFLRLGGKVIVTLFEGSPYTLWNIRDLARHSGLKVSESFRFDWADYPGYQHVRTLGAIEGGGGWKGEEREARMFVFEKVRLEEDSEEERERVRGKGKGKGKGGEKRKRSGGDGSGSDDD